MATTRPKSSAYVFVSEFLGVDFANDETNVDMRRSPDAPNMVADTAGRPQKRKGYQLVREFNGKINGIFTYGGKLLVHAGTSLFVQEGETWREIISDMGDNRSSHVVMDGKICILDGRRYTILNAELEEVTERFIPTTVIGRKPAGGGVFLEDPNLLTPWRKNSFTTDGTATEFLLDADKLDVDDVTVSVGGQLKVEHTDYEVDRFYGKIIFNAAPADDKGVDSVVVTFAKTVDTYTDYVRGCTICDTYGLGNDSRVFITGNPKYPNYDWQSGLYDPTYFPDTGYTRFGSEQTAVMGYMKQYDCLLVVKEQSDTETGIFLRTAELDADNVAIFPVQDGLAGIGAVSKHCFCSLPSDQVFLSKNGVYGMDSNSITQQRTAQLRSYYVNPRLVAEENLSEAVAAMYGRLYVLCVNGNCYVANTHAQNGNPSGSFGYEWYFWNNIPARVLREIDGKLYIGAEDGKLHVFKNGGTMGDYSDNGAAIDAMWTTPLLDGGDFTREKTISKKGTAIEAKPFTRSSGEIFFTTNKSLRSIARQYTMDIFDWDDIDFNRFTFNTTDQPQVQIAPKKYRKVLYFQMGVRNNAVNEGFGVLGMKITYTVGNLTRKKYG